MNLAIMCDDVLRVNAGELNALPCFYHMNLIKSQILPLAEAHEFLPSEITSKLPKALSLNVSLIAIKLIRNKMIATQLFIIQ